MTISVSGRTDPVRVRYVGGTRDGQEELTTTGHLFVHRLRSTGHLSLPLAPGPWDEDPAVPPCFQREEWTAEVFELPREKEWQVVMRCAE